MKAWFTRDRWYLLALAVLVPAATVAALSSDWFAYIDRTGGAAIPVATGERVEFAGATWTLTETTVIDGGTVLGDEIDLRPDNQLVSVTLEVEPGDPAVSSCDPQLTDGVRAWDEAQSSDSTFSIDDDANSYCDGSATEPYLVQYVFVVPEGAAQDARLELTILSETPAFLSFATR